jgi:hypothetical protein
MSRFYMTMTGGKSNSETVTRRGYSGANVVAASWNGAVRVAPYANAEGVDCVRVTREEWQGSGGSLVVLYDGPFKMDGIPAVKFKSDLLPGGDK